MEDHGRDVLLSDRPGGGALITLILPRHDIAEPLLQFVHERQLALQLLDPADEFSVAAQYILPAGYRRACPEP